MNTAPVEAETEALLRGALAIDPFDAAALHGLGRALLARGRRAEAVAMLAAAAQQGNDAAVLADLGSGLIQTGQTAEAERVLRQAVEAQPDLYAGLFNLGGLLLARETTEAIDLFRRARTAASADDDAPVALSNLLNDRGNQAYAEGAIMLAESLYREAIDTRPDFAGALSNLGNALTLQLRIPDALAAYRSALALEPDNDSIAFAYSLCLLLSGDEDNGWRVHEHRRNVPQMLSNYVRRPDLPQWHPGVSLAGKRVLVIAEQGAGDLLQYVRFAPALAKLAAAVVLEAPWSLAPVMRSLPGIEALIDLEAPYPACDIACPVVSLRLLLGAEAGLTPPYLAAPIERQARWAAWLDRGPQGRRIGLVCSGDSRHPHDGLRSIPLADLAPIFDAGDAAFVLVQSEIRDGDRAAFEAAYDLRSPEAALTDYGDTAALLAGLDLLITVDTSVAHLAGAMGLPVWTLLPFCPDYRWKLGRDDTPWYPTRRLYRQDRPGDWETVLRRVKNDLMRRV